MADAAAAGLDLANAVREARLAAGVQQVELARRAGITPSYLSRIEGAAWNHGGPWPSDQVLRSLARTLSLSSAELKCFDEFVWEPPGGWVEADATSSDEGLDEVERRRVRPPD